MDTSSEMHDRPAAAATPSAPLGAETPLAGWGNYPRVLCRQLGPETPKNVGRALEAVRAERATGRDRGGLVARGLGRSYGDPAINGEGLVLDLTRMDRYLAFDEREGLLTCEAGTSLEAILRDFAPRGFLPMITPGTKFVTVGGCIANDVHGKAHHVDGCFSSCVRSFELLLASGEIVTCSREENSDLFWANFGGVGLLGVILTATIQLRRVETTYFRQTAIRVANLEALLDAFEDYGAEPYSVAWIDPLARGERLGRGVLTVGDHAALDDLPRKLQRRPLAVSGRSPLFVPFEMPAVALNQTTVRMLDVVLENVQALGQPIAHYEKFFYPLDFVGEWWRGYGKRGFTQYQFVIPLEDGRRRMREILEVIAGSDQVPFLNVLKKLGAANAGHLSFPFEGYTFAIDFPVRDGLAELLRRLDAMVLDAGGRIYLGKDAFLDAATLAQMYPRLEEWKAIKARVDPDHIFTSDLGRRVALSH